MRTDVVGSLASFFEALTALLKVGVFAVLVVFVVAKWRYFARWLDSVTHFEGWGVKFDRAAALEKIERLIREKANSGATLPFAEAALARAARVLPALDGARVLWVDVKPQRNVLERGILEDIGIKVQLALSTDMALRLLDAEPSDLVISNLIRPDDTKQSLNKCPATYFDFPNRDLHNQYDGNLVRFNAKTQSDPPAGFAMAEILAQHNPSIFGDTQAPRIIFYTGQSGGKAANACARIITNRPDVLLQSVVSALEELRWRQLASSAGTRPRS